MKKDKWMRNRGNGIHGNKNEKKVANIIMLATLRGDD